MNPSQLCGFCQSIFFVKAFLLKTFISKTTLPTDYTLCENKNQCPFFTKTSLLEDYCTVLLYRLKQIYKDLPPFCEHVKTASPFLSRTEATFNRPFFKCANSTDHDPCSYFQWTDQDPNEYTLALKHPTSRYFSQKPPPPSPAAQLKKNKKRCLDPLKVTSIMLPAPKRTLQFKKEPKEPKNKKSKNDIPPLETATVLQEGNIQDAGTPCTPQELQSIEQLLEATVG